jgi:hypothetical protein
MLVPPLALLLSFQQVGLLSIPTPLRDVALLPVYPLHDALPAFLARHVAMVEFGQVLVVELELSSFSSF